MAVFPCKLRVMAEHVYTRRDPIVCGVRQMTSDIFNFFFSRIKMSKLKYLFSRQVRVEAGVVKTGTPICVPSKEFIFLGIITGIQHNNKDVDTAKKGDEVR